MSPSTHAPFGAWRLALCKQVLALVLDGPALVGAWSLLSAHWFARRCLGLESLVDAMDGAFLSSLERALSASTSATRDLCNDCLVSVPFVRLTMLGLRPHVWLSWQLLILTIHLPYLVCGVVLLCSWRHGELARGAALCTSRAELRQLVRSHAMWIAHDLLATPLVFIVVCGVWRLPTFISLTQQRAFRRGSGVRFFAAAGSSVFLMLQDLYLLLLMATILLTAVRLPHTVSAALTLRDAYRWLWADPRWQTNDGHAAQLMVVVEEIIQRMSAHATRTGGSLPVHEEHLLDWGGSGLHAFLVADAAALTGGGLVYVSRGQVRVVPRSLTLWKPMLEAEALLALGALPKLALLPLKAVAALICVPIVSYVRWRLSSIVAPTSSTEDGEAIAAAWAVRPSAPTGERPRSSSSCGS